MTDAGTTTRTATFDDVYAVLIEALTGLVGQEYVEEMEVGPDSRFEADLELESMEIAELAEQLMDRYGAEVDFVAWFADMDLDQLIELSVGDVARFIVASLAGERPGPAAGAGT
jgi:acyl carrier protein